MMTVHMGISLEVGRVHVRPPILGYCVQGPKMLFYRVVTLKGQGYKGRFTIFLSALCRLPISRPTCVKFHQDVIVIYL